jgi:hypothetical protein
MGTKVRCGRAVAVAVALCLWAGPWPAESALITVDLLPGDGLLTRDTNTGLDWLSWGAPASLSMDQILAGGGGWLALGFRFSTTAEVCALVNTYGPVASCPGGASGMVLDPTLFNRFVNPKVVHADGSLSGPPTRFDDGNLADGKAGRLSIGPYQPLTGSLDWVALLNVANTDEPGYSALVRAVPEPSAVLLLAPALSLLTVRARRPRVGGGWSRGRRGR